MKKLVILISLCCAIMASGYSQIEDVKVSNTITINQVYAGILSWTSASIDSLHATGYAGCRFGAAATWRPADWVAVKSMAMIQIDPGSTWSMNQFSLILNPWKKLTITAGNMGTLVTEIRPYPTTDGSQFETWTESRIPGMALGVKARWNFSEFSSLGGAVAMRNSKPEYQGSVSFGDKNGSMTVAGFYQDAKRYGAIVSVKNERYKTILGFYQTPQGELLANVINIFLGRENDWCLYSDAGYDFKNDKLVRGEWGILKTFQAPYLRGLIGPGYCYEARSVQLYLMLNLANK